MRRHEPSLILASQSPRRVELMRQLGFPFQVITPAQVDEKLHGAAPHALAMDNARAKARVIAAQHHDAVVLGADTIVVLDGGVFGKPRDHAEAETMLARLAGQRHEVLTGVCLVHRRFDTEITFYETTQVWMKPLNQEQRRAYLAAIEPLDKAGSYAIQDRGEEIIERIDGSYSNVIGLPLERVRGTLEKLGLVPAQDQP